MPEISCHHRCKEKCNVSLQRRISNSATLYAGPAGQFLRRRAEEKGNESRKKA